MLILKHQINYSSEDFLRIFDDFCMLILDVVPQQHPFKMYIFKKVPKVDAASKCILGLLEKNLSQSRQSLLSQMRNYFWGRSSVTLPGF